MVKEKKDEKELVTLYHVTFVIYSFDHKTLYPRVNELLCKKRAKTFKIEKVPKGSSYIGRIIYNHELNEIEVDDRYNGVLKFSCFCTEEKKEEIIVKIKLDAQKRLNSIKEYAEKRLEQINTMNEFEEFFIE